MTTSREHLRCLACGKVARPDAFRCRDHEMERLTQQFVGGKGAGHGFSWAREELKPRGGDAAEVELLFLSAVAIVERLRRYVDPALDPMAALEDEIADLKQQLANLEEEGQRKKEGKPKRRSGKQQRRTTGRQPPRTTARGLAAKVKPVAPGRAGRESREAPARGLSSTEVMRPTSSPIADRKPTQSLQVAPTTAIGPSPVPPAERVQPPQAIVEAVSSLVTRYGPTPTTKGDWMDPLLDFVRATAKPLLGRVEAIAALLDEILGDGGRPPEQEVLTRKVLEIFLAAVRREELEEEEAEVLLDLTCLHIKHLAENRQRPGRADHLTDLFIKEKLGDDDPDVERYFALATTVGRQMHEVLREARSSSRKQHGVYKPG